MQSFGKVMSCLRIIWECVMDIRTQAPRHVLDKKYDGNHLLLMVIYENTSLCFAWGLMSESSDVLKMILHVYFLIL